MSLNSLDSLQGLGQFADLRRGLAKKGGGIFEWGVDTPIHIMMTKVFCQFSLKYPLKYFVQRFTDKILQKHLLCISSELLLCLYFPTTDYLVFFSEYISRTAILTQASVITCK